MLVDKVIKFYNKDTYDLNCAETILYAANEEYNMNLTKETLKSVAAFGGGMAIESVCGAITGALVVLGILFTKERAHESEKIKELTKELIDRFNEALSISNCRELKEKYRNDDIRCTLIVEKAADILDAIVKREMLNLL